MIWHRDRRYSFYITSATAGLHFIHYKDRGVFRLATNTNLGENEPLFGSGSAPAKYCGRNSVIGRLITTGIRYSPSPCSPHETTDSCQNLFWLVDICENGDREICFWRTMGTLEPIGTAINNSLGEDVPVQVNPSPANPGLHLHVTPPPSLSVHTAWSLHPPLFSAQLHSSAPTDGVYCHTVSRYGHKLRHTEHWMAAVIGAPR